MVAVWKDDTLEEVSPTPVTFNHGVEGSRPSALNKLSPLYKGFLRSPTQSTTRETHLGSVWVVGWGQMGREITETPLNGMQ